MKVECVGNQSMLVILFGGISVINALGEPVLNVFPQFLQLCRITLHKPLHNTHALES